MKQKLFVTEGEERTHWIQEGKKKTLVTEERFHPLYLLQFAQTATESRH